MDPPRLTHSHSHSHSRDLRRSKSGARKNPQPPRNERSNSFDGRWRWRDVDRRLLPGPDVHTAVDRKVLIKATVLSSLGPIPVMVSKEWSVEQLVAAAVSMYVKEGRRPPLPTTEPSAFALHYSQFSFECLDPKQKLIDLGSRNFFICPKSLSSSSSSPPQLLSCSKFHKEASSTWLRIIDFVLERISQSPPSVLAFNPICSFLP